MIEYFHDHLATQILVTVFLHRILLVCHAQAVDSNLSPLIPFHSNSSHVNSTTTHKAMLDILFTVNNHHSRTNNHRFVQVDL
mmetsp:Transcript_27816/g.38320  ORF Transcript_27816/g.38320 Transcript_27816/m.38320 type:complete len:82 (-) Transcript_27816:310-555(-)